MCLPSAHLWKVLREVYFSHYWTTDSYLNNQFYPVRQLPSFGGAGGGPTSLVSTTYQALNLQPSLLVLPLLGMSLNHTDHWS